MAVILLPGRYARQNYEAWNGTFEKYRIGWEATSFTPPHDHGQSEGTILVLMGKVREIQFDAATKQFLSCQSFGPSGVILEKPGRIQIMASEEGSLTDHTFHRAPMTMTEFGPECLKLTPHDLEQLPQFVRSYIKQAIRRAGRRK